MYVVGDWVEGNVGNLSFGDLPKTATVNTTGAPTRKYHIIILVMIMVNFGLGEYYFMFYSIFKD